MDTSSISNILFSLATLTILEIILGVDNLVFISITSSRLPQHQQKRARRVGLAMAWITRLLLLASAVWIASLKKPLLTLFEFSFSARDLFLLGGGLFLLVKATQEIHYELEQKEAVESTKKFATFKTVVIQIAILDIIFSLDSVITAIGLTNQFWIMATAISIAILCMIFASEPLSAFVTQHPTVKMLALSFLILIGMVLVADGLHFHIPRGYIYFSICFSIFVEFLNSIYRRKRLLKEQQVNDNCAD